MGGGGKGRCDKENAVYVIREQMNAEGSLLFRGIEEEKPKILARPDDHVRGFTTIAQLFCAYARRKCTLDGGGRLANFLADGVPDAIYRRSKTKNGNYVHVTPSQFWLR